jgi:RimJ/RimL family protein N-acetyltransferase
MIIGERVRLRAAERKDIPCWVKWLNDPEVLQGLMLFAPMSHADEEGWFDNMLRRPAEQHVMVIEIKLDESWIPVGNFGFNTIDWRCRAADVGIFIGEKQYWNQGYGTEVMRLMLSYGFKTLNLNRIALEVYETNPRAIRSYEKAGFVREGCKRQAMYKNGEYVDVIMMSVLRSEWLEAQGA